MTTAALLVASAGFAQSADEIKQEAAKIRAELKPQYSHFSIGVYGGLPFYQGGDMHTLAHQKTHFGYVGGLQLGYQFNPYLGISLTGQYGKGKTGAKPDELNFRVLPSGVTDRGLDPSPGAVNFSDINSQIAHMAAGLHLDFNIAPLFSSSPNRKMAVILSPGVYVQKFTPELLKVADGTSFAKNSFDQPLTFGAGGNLDIRFRASKHLDLLLKGGAAWIANNPEHDGIKNEFTDLKYAVVGQVAAGLIFKLGNSDKVDNVLYAPTCRYINRLAGERVAARLEAERIAKEKAEAERLAREKAEAERLAREREEAERRRLAEEEAARAAAAAAVVEVNLPNIHFVRGSAKVNTRKYAAELKEILDFINANPTLNFEINGYTDHTGTETLNDRLSIRRAEALKSYLVKKGVDAARLSTKGNGKDQSLSGKEALSIKARRVEVK